MIWKRTKWNLKFELKKKNIHVLRFSPKINRKINHLEDSITCVCYMKPHISWFKRSTECSLFIFMHFFQFHYLFQNPWGMKNAKSNREFSIQNSLSFENFTNKILENCKHRCFFYSNGDQEIFKYLNITCRSSRPEVFCKINFRKILQNS